VEQPTSEIVCECSPKTLNGKGRLLRIKAEHAPLGVRQLDLNWQSRVKQ
jgi:hypothetical protein